MAFQNAEDVGNLNKTELMKTCRQKRDFGKYSGGRGVRK